MVYNLFSKLSGSQTLWFFVADEKWLSSLSLPPNIGEIDGQFMEKNQKIFSSLERAGRNK